MATSDRQRFIRVRHRLLTHGVLGVVGAVGMASSGAAEPICLQVHCFDPAAIPAEPTVPPDLEFFPDTIQPVGTGVDYEYRFEQGLDPATNTWFQLLDANDRVVVDPSTLSSVPIAEILRPDHAAVFLNAAGNAFSRTSMTADMVARPRSVTFQRRVRGTLAM